MTVGGQSALTWTDKGSHYYLPISLMLKIFLKFSKAHFIIRQGYNFDS